MNAQTETFDELEKDLTKNYNVSEPVEKLEKENGIELSHKNINEIEDVYTEDMDEIKSFFAQTE